MADLHVIFTTCLKAYSTLAGKLALVLGSVCKLHNATLRDITPPAHAWAVSQWLGTECSELLRKDAHKSTQSNACSSCACIIQ